MKQDAFSRFHPLVNFIFFLGAMGISVVVQHPAYVAVSCLCGAWYLLILNPATGWKTLLGLLPVFLFLSGINPLFNTYGEIVLFTVFGRPYTLEALYYGMDIAGIFVAMMLWFGCYSRVLTSDKFVSLFGSLIPALSLLLVMVLRMIPNLIRKCRQILHSRRSIGKGVNQGSSGKEKLHDAVTTLSALTDWALEGSIVTADSMRSRGYGCAKRTTFQNYRMTGGDWGLLALMLLLLALVFSFGGMEASFTPQVSIAAPTLGLPAYGLFLFLPIALQIKEAILWRICISKI